MNNNYFNHYINNYTLFCNTINTQRLMKLCIDQAIAINDVLNLYALISKTTDDTYDDFKKIIYSSLPIINYWRTDKRELAFDKAWFDISAKNIEILNYYYLRFYTYDLQITKYSLTTRHLSKQIRLSFSRPLKSVNEIKQSSVIWLVPVFDTCNNLPIFPIRFKAFTYSEEQMHCIFTDRDHSLFSPNISNYSEIFHDILNKRD